MKGRSRSKNRRARKRSGHVASCVATALLAALVSASACNVFEARSGDLQCDGPTDCAAPRVCENRYCVLPSTTPDADPSAPDADPNAPDADPSAPDADPAADAFVGPDAAPSSASIQLVGQASCAGPSTAITVPAAGLSIGSVALVHIYRRASVGGVTSVVDSRGNSYSEIQISGGEGTRGFLWQATITTALVAGDTITVAESNGDSAVIVAELRNANPIAFSTQGATADDGLVDIGFTSTSPGVVFCAGGNRGGSIQLEPAWMQLANLSADCGGGQGTLTSFAHWLVAGTDGISACKGSFTFPTGFEQWVGIVGSYGD